MNKNNYPLVQIHCIIKMMCQDLPLRWLDCLFGLGSAKTETLAVVRDFTFLTGRSNGSETFCTLFIYKIFIFTNFGRIFLSTRGMVNVQIITDCSVFDRLCFLCVVCLFRWFYGFLWWPFAIKKLKYSRYNAKNKIWIGLIQHL